MAGRVQEFEQELMTLESDGATSAEPTVRAAAALGQGPQQMGPGEELERSLAASRADLVAVLESQGWELTPDPVVPAVFLMEQRRDSAKALLVQDACHLFMEGTSPLHERFTGLWFSRETLGADPRNLTALEADASGEDAAAAAGEDLAGAPGLARGIPGLSLPLVRNFSHINVALNACLAMRVENCHLAMRMVGPRSLQEYVRTSSRHSRHELRTNNGSAESGDVAVIVRCNTHMGHFEECVLPMQEAARHMITAEPGGHETAGASPAKDGHQASVQQGIPPANFTVFFPTEDEVHSPWSVGNIQLMFGAPTRVQGGRWEGRPVCFRFAMFILDSNSLPSSVDLWHQRAWNMVDWVRVALEGKQPSASPPRFPVQDTLARLAAEAQVDRLRTAGQVKRLKAVLGSFGHEQGLAPVKAGKVPPGRFQVTVVEREGKRLISNMGAVVATVRELFPRLPVKEVRFNGASLAEQIALMKHTVLLVCMHGATLSNLIYMPRGSVLVEIFPYHFKYGRFRIMAQNYGVKYFLWENEHYSNSSYNDNCMEENGYFNLSTDECRSLRVCKFCVRDHATTTVHTGELAEVLRSAQGAVKDFFRSMRSTLTP